MGCPRLEIYTHTLASFPSASLIAAVIATPVIYTYTGRWLQTYSYRIYNHWWIYLLALLIVGVIAALSISYRAVQLMNTNHQSGAGFEKGLSGWRVDVSICHKRLKQARFFLSLPLITE